MVPHALLPEVIVTCRDVVELCHFCITLHDSVSSLSLLLSNIVVLHHRATPKSRASSHVLDDDDAVNDGYDADDDHGDDMDNDDECCDDCKENRMKVAIM
jgi:hypothetical protein